MLTRNLIEVWISEYETTNDHGEKTKKWKFKEMDTKSKTAFLNLQQDINELDRNSNGEIDYDIQKARTDQNYNIKNGYGISLIDISNEEDFKPQYRVLDQRKIGNSTIYRLEEYHGD